MPCANGKISQCFHLCQSFMFCFLLSSPRSHRVILGEYDRQSGAEPIQVKTIAKVSMNMTDKIFIFSSVSSSVLYCVLDSFQAITHPYYNSQNFNNDITLLKLSSPAQLTSRVSPVCLAASTSSIPSGTTCVTTGWGRTGQTCECVLKGQFTYMSIYGCVQFNSQKCEM